MAMKTSTPNNVVGWYASRAKQRINVIAVGSLVQTLCETQVVLRIPDLDSKFTYPVNCQSPKQKTRHGG
ncbi:unnamed protein product [Fusarium graminearum]|uniref:Uncharacterized protein n=1 Tax=Gibberella zeae TaxID=5518 RepID=A0A4E9EDL2_GIBZA|nr:unnamed protein product [Fusarium graminearum]